MKTTKYLMYVVIIFSLLGSLLHAPPVSAYNTELDGFQSSTNDTVYTSAIQSTGKIVVGGEFTQLNGSTRNRIGRLLHNGSLDTTFDPNANNRVRAIAIQTDDKILVGGEFTNIAGTARNCFARL